MSEAANQGGTAAPEATGIPPSTIAKEAAAAGLVVKEGAASAPKAPGTAPASAENGAGGSPSLVPVVAPEGVEVNPAVLKDINARAVELGMSQESAQAMLEMNVAQEMAYVQSQEDGWSARIEGWKAECAADKDLSAAGVDDLINGIVEKYGDESLVEFLDPEAMGHHPALRRLLLKVANAGAEDTIAGAATGGSAGMTEEEKHQRHLKARYDHPTS